MRLDKALKFFIAITCGLFLLISSGCGGNSSPEDDLLSTRVFVPTISTLENTIITFPDGGQIEIQSILSASQDGTSLSGAWQLLNTQDNFASTAGLEEREFQYEIIDRNNAIFTFFGTNTDAGENLFFSGIFDGSNRDGTTPVTLEFTTTNSDINDITINPEILVPIFNQATNGEVTEEEGVSGVLFTTSLGTPIPTAFGLDRNILGDIDIPNTFPGTIFFNIFSDADFISHAFPIVDINGAVALNPAEIEPIAFVDDFFNETAQSAAGIITTNDDRITTTPSILTVPVIAQDVSLRAVGATAPIFSDLGVQLVTTSPIFPATISTDAVNLIELVYTQSNLDVEYFANDVTDTATIFLGNGNNNNNAGRNDLRSAVIRIELQFTNSRGGVAEFFFNDDNLNIEHYYENLLSIVPLEEIGQLFDGDEEEIIEITDDVLDDFGNSSEVILDEYSLISRPTNGATKFAEAIFNFE